MQRASPRTFLRKFLTCNVFVFYKTCFVACEVRAMDVDNSVTISANKHKIYGLNS